MQFLTQLLSKLIFCVGIMVTVVSCILASVIESGVGRGPAIGIALMILGAVLWQKTSTKVCPGCAERVKYHARKCQYCGRDLAG